MIIIGINGFTRTICNFLRLLCDDLKLSKEITIGLINIGPGSIESIVQLLKYDALLGTYPLKVTIEGDFLVIAHHKIRICTQPDVSVINWKEYGISWVIEASGICQLESDLALFKNVNLLLTYATPCVQDVIIQNSLHTYKDQKSITLGTSCDQVLVPLLQELDPWLGIENGYVTVFDAYMNDYIRRENRCNQNINLEMIQRSAARTIFLKNKNVLFGYPNIKVLEFSMPLERSTFIECYIQIHKNINQESLMKEFRYKFSNSCFARLSDVNLMSYDGIESDKLLIDGTLLHVDGKMLRICGWYDSIVVTSVRLKELLKKLSHM